jgi:hypothetical protein
MWRVTGHAVWPEDGSRLDGHHVSASSDKHLYIVYWDLFLQLQYKCSQIETVRSDAENMWTYISTP